MATRLFLNTIGLWMLALLLSTCTVGPDYVQPSVEIPEKYKEAAEGWKVAQPQDDHNRGDWWKVFNDPTLNTLEDQVKISNQNIATFEAQYRQARALVDQARAGYAPTLTSSLSLTRQKPPHFIPTISVPPYTDHSMSLTAAWEPDLWGSVRRTVESSEAGAQASAAALASAQLSAQASLAQYYFQLRALDADQKLLDDLEGAYRKLLQLTQGRYGSGVAAQMDILQAQNQLQSAQVQAVNNGIKRAQYEHAIAVLIGKPASVFSLKPSPFIMTPPSIPVQVPSVLLERRPDVAQAERQMAQANAQIGVAIAAFFPTLTLAATGGFDYTSSTGLGQTGLGRWLSAPAQFWSLGPQLAAILFDGGLRDAKTAAARAAYDASVASYRQTVLTAFQDVEDNLSSLRILASEAKVQDETVANTKRLLNLTINQYNAGTVAYADVITAQTNAYMAQKNAIDIASQHMTSAVGLIKALGGGWDATSLKMPAK